MNLPDATMDVPDGWSARTVSANGTDLRCYRTGDGPPIVLAHGFYDAAACWTPLVDDLADDHELFLYDARAHGDSAAPEAGYAIEDRVGDLVGVVEAFDVEDPILLGHSMGGSTAAWTAATHPDLPRGVVLEDPAGMLTIPKSSPEERARGARENVREWADRGADAIEAEYDALYGDEHPSLARHLAAARIACRPEIGEITREGFPPSRDAFEDIECPTLVLKADADPADRAADLDAADELADGRLVHVHGAGHTVFRDRYDAAYAELRTFLRRV